MAFSAGIRLGPGNLPARASTPGTRTWASAMGLLYSYCAELELGDLPERVDLIDGQQVRRRLPEVERYEAVAPGLPVRDPRFQLDHAAPGADPGHVAVGQAEVGGVVRVDEHQRLGGDRVQRVGPAGHRPGVPVLQHPPGVQDERVFLVGQFPGGQPLGGHQVREPVVRVELLGEHHHGAVAAGRVRVGIQLAARAEVIVGQVPVAGDDRDQFLEDVPGRLVLPVQADPVGDVLHDLPVDPGLARRVEHLAAELHAAVGVGVGALLLQVGGGGQDHVGELGGLGQEDVLHHQEIELGQGLAHLVDVRVGQERVLAQHVHAADAARQGGSDDLGDGQALLRVEVGGAPGLLEPAPDAGVVGLGVVRVEHRDQAHIGGALHVVLPAQRVQARARLADVPGDRAQRDQATGVVGAGGVLGDPHAPVDDARLGLAPYPGNPPDQVGGHAGDLLGALRRVVGHGALERLVVRGSRLDEGVVGQAQPDDLVHDGVVEGDVGAGLELAVDVRVVRHLVGPRIHVDDRRAVAPGLLEEAGGDRVVRGRVAAGDDGHAGVPDVAVGGGDRPGADPLEQRRDAGGVAQPGAVVDVVGVEAGADELLEEIGLLVGALRAAEPGDGGRAALGVDLAQPACHQVQRLFPAGLPEVRQHLGVVDEAAGLAAALAALALALRVAVVGHPVIVALAAAAGHVTADVGGQRPLGVGLLAPDQRHRQPLRRRRVVPAVPALDAEPALRSWLLPAVGVGDRAALAVHVVGQRAAHAAVRADGIYRVELSARPDRDVVDRLVGERAGRAGGDAFAAGHAGRGAHRVAEVERDVRGVALAAAPDYVVALDVVAGPGAPVAEDAGVVVDRDDRAGQIHAAAGAAREPGVVTGHLVPVRQREQLVVAGGGLLGVALTRRLVGDQQASQ